MKECKSCGSEFEDLGTAYLTGDNKRENVCAGCKDTLEKTDLIEFAEKHAEALCDELNGGSSKEIGIALAHGLNRQHRYLQGEFFNMLWHFFRTYRTFAFDGRNEFAVKLAAKWDEQVGK